MLRAVKVQGPHIASTNYENKGLVNARWWWNTPLNRGRIACFCWVRVKFWALSMVFTDFFLGGGWGGWQGGRRVTVQQVWKLWFSAWISLSLSWQESWDALLGSVKFLVPHQPFLAWVGDLAADVTDLSLCHHSSLRIGSTAHSRTLKTSCR